MAGRSALKSKFECSHPEKYIGDPTNVICRSSWERFFCSNLDNNPNVEKWASEEIAIKYISPKDGREHRYFVDFVVRFKNGKTVMIEIKPFGQTIPPEKPKKNSNKALARFHEEFMVYSVNQAKWKAATDFCNRNGFQFLVYTEKQLRNLGMPI
jgi:hypothetical protein